MDTVTTLPYMWYDEYVLVDEADNPEVSHDNRIPLQKLQDLFQMVIQCNSLTQSDDVVLLPRDKDLMRTFRVLTEI